MKAYERGFDNDATAPQMLLTIRITTFAFDYYDGIKNLEGNSKLSNYQKNFAFTGFPSLIEFFGYVFHYNGFLAGPCFNFREYRDYIDLSMFKFVILINFFHQFFLINFF